MSDETQFEEQLRSTLAQWTQTDPGNIEMYETLQTLWTRTNGPTVTPFVQQRLAELLCAAFSRLDLPTAIGAVGQCMQTVNELTMHLRGKVIPPKKPGGSDGGGSTTPMK